MVNFSRFPVLCFDFWSETTIEEFKEQSYVTCLDSSAAAIETTATKSFLYFLLQL